MNILTARQREVGRRQLELEKDLIARGMTPLEAQEAAGRGTFMTEQARYSIDAANAPLDAGNGAEVDNLAGAESPISVDDMLGGPAMRVAPPQSDRVYRDDPTMGGAGMLAAREAAQLQRDAERAAMYDQRAAEYTEEYGMKGVAGAAPITREQEVNRRNRLLSESEARHTPYAEDARIARLAERAGVPVPVAAQMVQEGYNDYAKGKNVQPWTVAGVNNTVTPPDFQQMAYAHRELRQMGDERRRQEQAAREQAVIRRRMAQTNPLEYMNREDISDWNRMVAADHLLRRGYRGATPLDADAAHNAQLTQLGLRVAMGQGYQQPNAAQDRLADARASAAEREANPEAAAIRDIQEGRYIAGPGRTHLGVLGKEYDQNWLGGASRDQKPALVQRLTQPPYNLSPEAASNAADVALGETDWW